MQAFTFAQTEDDFYAPLDSATDRGTEYQPSQVPPEWTSVCEGIFAHWHTADKLHGVEQGWKIHVSARMERAAWVLEAAAPVFFAEGVAFKHISCSRFFLVIHHKHATRQQSGKFITAYPPDEITARRLMEALSEALSGETGPFVLTDRRYREPGIVHYRYGAFVARSRMRPDGLPELLIKDGHGREVPDRRGLSFVLPDGISDPFVDPGPATVDAADPAADDPHSLNGYAFERAIRYSNGGGTYECRELATGRRVFVKEARAHNGLTGPHATAQDRLRTEYETLRALHDRLPGICPEPLRYFRLWEHEFLASEYVEGISLVRWMVKHNPIIWSAATAQDLRTYHRRCLRIVDALAETLHRLHQLGYVFIDLNPNNVIVDDADRPRLVDFEVAGSVDGPLEPIGAPGYFPPAELVAGDPRVYDEYGLSSLALALIAPLNSTADRNPSVLFHLRHQLDQRTRVPKRLWTIATRFRTEPSPDGPPVPGPAQVAAEPLKHLTELRDGLVRGLLATADPSRPGAVFPLGPTGYLTNTLCVEHGLAGVVHALGKAGVPLPDGVLKRLTADALDSAGDLPPGLHVGSAGIAWVLADHGLLDEAGDLLDAADGHPALADSGTLGAGRAGVGLAHLALFGHTGDQRHADRALALAAGAPGPGRVGDDASPDDDRTGLLSGRAGVALLDYYLGRVTGDSAHLDRGLRLLHGELSQAVPSNGGLLFPVSTRDRRLMPYLYAGAAAFGFVASRYLSVLDDERLTAAMPGLLTAATCGFTHYGGLYNGMAGLGLFLADHAGRHEGEPGRAAAYEVGRRLFMYAVPRPSGIYLLGEHGLRLSTDLGNGSAGVLLFVDHLLERRTDAFLTLDALVEGHSAGTAAAARPIQTPGHPAWDGDRSRSPKSTT